MSVRDRLDDCILLMRQDRLEGALLSALIAAAATSRKRYPSMRDGDAFRQFIADETLRLTRGMTRQVQIEFEGEFFTLESILYKFVRCHLAHEAKLFPKVSFEMGDFLLRKKTTDHLTFSSALVVELVNAVAEAPENKDEFAEYLKHQAERGTGSSGRTNLETPGPAIPP